MLYWDNNTKRVYKSLSDISAVKEEPKDNSQKKIASEGTTDEDNAKKEIENEGLTNEDNTQETSESEEPTDEDKLKKSTKKSKRAGTVNDINN